MPKAKCHKCGREESITESMEKRLGENSELVYQCGYCNAEQADNYFRNLKL